LHTKQKTIDSEQSIYMFILEAERRTHRWQRSDKWYRLGSMLRWVTAQKAAP